ncbi:unnamed protein product [Cyclocybe aegerita]|uniref:Uncharacterized protein n=1 Tax=Cyclocybe aegerita TaxID=1973307 RepID=A0A8S0W6A7_CYCAE|nr:unnamed protein product [Cyclocybe aegerita]
MSATTNSASNPAALHLLPAFSTRAAYAEYIARVEQHLLYLKEDFRLQWPSNANANTDATVKQEQLEVRVGTFEGLIDDDARSTGANYGSPSHLSERSASPIPSVRKQESASPSPSQTTRNLTTRRSSPPHSSTPYPGWKPIGYVPPTDREVRREPALTQVDNGDHVVWMNAEYARWNFERMPQGSKSTSSHYTTPEDRIPRPSIIVFPPAARPAAAEVAQPEAGPSDVVARVEAVLSAMSSDSSGEAGSSKSSTRKRFREEDDSSSDDSDARPRKRSTSSDSGSSQPSSPTTSGPRRVKLILGPDPSSSTPRRSPRSPKGKGKETKKGNN